MITGKRVLANPRFNIMDGSWDDTDIAACGHRLYGIVTRDIYSHYEQGEFDRFSKIPDSICDQKHISEPAMVHLRDKRQPAIGGRLWCYKQNPSKVRGLHKYLVSLVNFQRSNYKVKRVTIKDSAFQLFSFVTISANGYRCLWKITVKTKDEANQPVKYPILAKINSHDAGLHTFSEQLRIAGDMTYSECDMKNRKFSTLACSLSNLT